MNNEDLKRIIFHHKMLNTKYFLKCLNKGLNQSFNEFDVEDFEDSPFYYHFNKELNNTNDGSSVRLIRAELLNYEILLIYALKAKEDQFLLKLSGQDINLNDLIRGRLLFDNYEESILKPFIDFENRFIHDKTEFDFENEFSSCERKFNDKKSEVLISLNLINPSLFSNEIFRNTVTSAEEILSNDSYSYFYHRYCQEDYSKLNLALEKKIKQIERERVENLNKIEHTDFEEVVKENFKGLVGLENVKSQLVRICKLAKKSPKQLQNLNFIITGNSGVGKTTLAKVMSKVFYQCGIIKSDHFILRNGAELKAGYVGQTTEKVKTLFNNNKGGTIFVDEAYSLINSEGKDDSYVQEALTELMLQLDKMKEEKEKTLVILAGYEDRILKNL